jgi:hypothetical protein
VNHPSRDNAIVGHGDDWDVCVTVLAGVAVELFTHVKQQKIGNNRNRPDLRSANPVLAGSSRSRSLDPLGRSVFESAAVVMAGAERDGR